MKRAIATALLFGTAGIAGFATESAAYRPTPVIKAQQDLSAAIRKAWRGVRTKTGLRYRRTRFRLPATYWRARRARVRGHVHFRNEGDKVLDLARVRYRLRIDGRRIVLRREFPNGIAPRLGRLRLSLGPHWVRLTVLGRKGKRRQVYRGQILVTGPEPVNLVLKSCRTVATCRAVIVDNRKLLFGGQ